MGLECGESDWVTVSVRVMVMVMVMIRIRREGRCAEVSSPSKVSP